jgi:hypothetical protein
VHLNTALVLPRHDQSDCMVSHQGDKCWYVTESHLWRLGFRIWQCFFPNPFPFVISYKFLMPIIGLDIFLSLLVYWSLLILVSYGSERSDWTHVQVLHESFLFLITFLFHWSPRIVNNISLPIIYIRHPVARISEINCRYYKVVQIWPGQTVTCLHTNRPGHIWTTLYSLPITRNKSVLFFANYLSTVSSKSNVCILWHTYASFISLPNFRLFFFYSKESVKIQAKSKRLQCLLLKHIWIWRLAPLLLNLGSQLSWELSITPWALYPRDLSLRYAFHIKFQEIV